MKLTTLHEAMRDYYATPITPEQIAQIKGLVDDPAGYDDAEIAEMMGLNQPTVVNARGELTQQQKDARKQRLTNKTMMAMGADTTKIPELLRDPAAYTYAEISQHTRIPEMLVKQIAKQTQVYKDIETKRRLRAKQNQPSLLQPQPLSDEHEFQKLMDKIRSRPDMKFDKDVNFEVPEELRKQAGVKKNENWEGWMQQFSIPHRRKLLYAMCSNNRTPEEAKAVYFAHIAKRPELFKDPTNPDDTSIPE